MTRIRSRQLISACVALIVGLSACGSAAKTSVPTTIAPKVIVVGANAGNGGDGTASLASVAEASASTKMMVRNVTYKYDGDAADLTAPASSWFFAPGAEPTSAQISTVAKLLGVAGQAQRMAPDQGGGWLVGPQDHSGATLAITGDAMSSWYYSPAQMSIKVAVSCAGVAMPGIEPGIDPVIEPGIDPATPAPPNSPPSFPAPAPAPATPTTKTDMTAPEATAPDFPVCDQPQPPANVPTTEQAKAKAIEFFAALGLDLGSYDLEAYADQWSANVMAYLKLDGIRTNVSRSVGYGAEGAITWASGFLATATRGGDYPRIGVQAAVQRLNAHNGVWMRGVPGKMGMMTAAQGGIESGSGTTQAPPLAPTPLETTGGGTAGGAPIGIDDNGIDNTGATMVAPPQQCDVAVDCAPVDASVTVTLTNAKPSLEQLWAQDGTIWLMPGYSFDSSDGGTYSVIAVEDIYIQTEPDVSTLDTKPAVPPVTDPVTSIIVEPGQVPATTAETRPGMTVETAVATTG